MTIPRRIVQVWLGDDPPPLRWIETWAAAHPDWEHHLWRERDIEEFGLKNVSLFRSLLEAKVYDAASDVARVEIVERIGGVYADADSLCVKRLDDAWFMDAGFFVVQEIPPSGAWMVSNAFFGGEAGHPILRRYIDRIARARVRCSHGGEGAAFCCAWKTTGPRVLTSVVARSPEAMVLPPSVFYETDIKGRQVPPGPRYATHYWSSTTERSPKGQFAGTAYPA